MSFHLVSYCCDRQYFGEMVSELIELSAVIGEIYDAALDPTLWQQALASICAYVGGSSAVLAWHDSATVRSQALHLFNADPHYHQLYFEKYLPMNPIFPAGTFVDAGVVSTSDDIVPRAELTKTRFYKEWLKPQNIVDALSVNLEKGVARSSFINIRTEVRTTQAMRGRLAMLVPHLLRAVMIGRVFDQKAATERALTQTLDHIEAAVFLVGADGTIVFRNESAKKLIVEATVVKEEGSKLLSTAPEANRTLRDLFMSVENGDASMGARGVAVPLTTAPSEPWFAHVLPLTSGRRQRAAQDYAAVAAVFIRKTEPDAPSPLEGIAKRYKLSAGEVRVLQAMMKVNGVKAMARTLGLSQATIKTHLHNLFRKTKTTRQSELLKLIAGLA